MNVRHGGRRAALIGLVDLAVATAAAILVFSLVGAVSGDDTNPPVCHNGSGHLVSCSLTQQAVMAPTFGVVFLGLAGWQLNAARKRRAHEQRVS